MILLTVQHFNVNVKMSEIMNSHINNNNNGGDMARCILPMSPLWLTDGLAVNKTGKQLCINGDVC